MAKDSYSRASEQKLFQSISAVQAIESPYHVVAVSDIWQAHIVSHRAALILALLTDRLPAPGSLTADGADALVELVSKARIADLSLYMNDLGDAGIKKVSHS